MFFSAELLSRRDSGFGLLWMAATLGAKSSLKKLPRRSVLTADISQLCELIAEPAEPLALRLSSNLMVGVVRVYGVKQEILLTDTTVCFNTLKKAVSEIHASSTGDLQMGQPTARPEAVTRRADPVVAFAMDMEHLFQWDQSQATQRAGEEDESDDEFDPSGKKAKKKAKAKPPSTFSATLEQARPDAHTLQEHHAFLLSSSFQDNDYGGGFVSSSSQIGGFGGLDDNLGDLGAEIGDELARELGWELPGDREDARTPTNDEDILMGEVEGQNELDIGNMGGGMRDDLFDIPSSAQGGTKRPASVLGEDQFAPEGSIILPLSPLDLSQGQEEGQAAEQNQKAPKSTKKKSVRLLLDARTEFTYEELERARAAYLEQQAELRKNAAQKKAEKDSGRMFEEMIWGAPRGFTAPALVDFWLDNFKIQVEATSGKLRLETEGPPPRKRRRVDEDGMLEEEDLGEPRSGEGQGMDFAMDFAIDQEAMFQDGVNEHLGRDDGSILRSSEEPGQGRRDSRPPSLPGSHIDFLLNPTQELNLSSQRSNLFPWDNAGVSSSVSGVAFVPGSGTFSAGRGSVQRRGSTVTQDSPLPAGLTDSPVSFGRRGFNLASDGFEFEVPAENAAAANESQLSDASALTLERNSFNFLEYAKMQLAAAPSATNTLDFDGIVPAESSTRHVAAAGFYHCLVLATKDLIGIKQEEPYESIAIVIK